MGLCGRYMLKKAISWTYNKYLGKNKKEEMDKEAIDKLVAKGKEMMNDPVYCYIDGKKYRRNEVDKLVSKGKKKLDLK